MTIALFHLLIIQFQPNYGVTGIVCFAWLYVLGVFFVVWPYQPCFFREMANGFIEYSSNQLVN